MDFGGLLVLGVLWLLFNLFGRAQGGARPRPRTTRDPSQPGPYPRDPSASDPTQREGSRLEQLLRELERNLEQAGGGRQQPAARLPTPRLPDDEDVEERESLERPERVVSLETVVTRPQRVEYDQDTGAEELVRRRIAAAEARSGPIKRIDHAAFDARIRQEPADQTQVRRYTQAQLRKAIVWREILGPPVSERDP